MRVARASVGTWRTPRAAIVCATEAICERGGKRPKLADRRRADLEWRLISAAGGSVLGTSPGTLGVAVPAEALGGLDERARAPTFTPSGANTELHEWAKLSRNVPPQYSPLAFSSSTPSIVAAVATGNSSEASPPASSAAAA